MVTLKSFDNACQNEQCSNNCPFMLVTYHLDMITIHDQLPHRDAYLKENLCEHKWLRFSKINSLVSITHLAKVQPPPTSSFYPELGHFPRFISKRRVYWNCQSWNELWVVFCNLGLILELMIVMVYLYILMDSPSWLRWSYWNC